VFGYKIEVVPVFFGESADAEIGFRKIDAFGRTELRFARARVDDLDQDVFGMNLADAAFNLAVVEEDRLARQRGREDLWKRAGDVREAAMRRRRAGFFFGQHE
jgi:hypothetical protein